VIGMTIRESPGITQPTTEPAVLLDRLALRTGGVAALLSLNRPESLNPLDGECMAALRVAVDEVGEDDSVRAVLITGKGRAFSAGGDLKKYVKLQRDPVAWPALMASNHAFFEALRTTSKPVVALINGVTAAGGLEILLSCDFAYAAQSARIGDLHLRYGQMGGAGSLAILPRNIPPARARELVYSGDLLAAEEALEWGLVNRVVPDDELLAAGIEFAEKVAAKSPLAVANAKFVMNRGLEDGLGVRAHLQLEAERTIRYVMTSSDAPEGLSAFIEKRTPRFEGR
jgi:enoyl-CoA hydratase